MLVGVIGINHQSASLELREQMTLPDLRMPSVVLSTCNRTEIYFSGKEAPLLEAPFYAFFGADCFCHLASVTAGLNSAFLAESSIQFQVKSAYEKARVEGPLPSSLHYLFQKSLKIAKDARSSFSLFQSKNPLEEMVVKLMDAFLEKEPFLLFMGLSDVNRKIISYLSRRKKCRITLVSRNLRAAYSFASAYGLTLKSYDELANAHRYDAICSATTGAQGYLLSSFQPGFSTRLILDLSFPRTIDPSMGKCCTLINMQQLGELFEKMRPAQETEVAKVRSFVNAKAVAYAERFQEKQLLYT